MKKFLFLNLIVGLVTLNTLNAVDCPKLSVTTTSPVKINFANCSNTQASHTLEGGTWTFPNQLGEAGVRPGALVSVESLNPKAESKKSAVIRMEGELKINCADVISFVCLCSGRACPTEREALEKEKNMSCRRVVDLVCSCNGRDCPKF